MRPTISQLRGWNPGQLTAAGEAAQNNATALDGALDSVVRAMSSNSQWSGQTRFAAQNRVYEERDHASEVRNVLQQIADESKDAAQDLSHSRDYVLREVDGAAAAGFTVSDTGQVTHTDPEKDEEAATIEARIQSGLTTVDEHDETYGSRLDALKGDLAAMVNGQPDVALPDGTTADADDVVKQLRWMSTDERREFLSRMTQDDVRRLVQANPEYMGNTHGVPFGVRTVANEINIRNAIADEVRAGNDVPGKNERVEKLRDLLRQQDDPHAIGSRGANPADDHKVERQFIAFQNTANGRFIEMVGGLNPSTKNAAVYVPGTGSNLNGSSANTNAALNLARETGRPGDRSLFSWTAICLRTWDMRISVRQARVD